MLFQTFENAIWFDYTYFNHYILKGKIKNLLKIKVYGYKCFRTYLQM